MKELEQLGLYPDMKVEVLTSDNKLLFMGKVEEFENGVLQIRDGKDQALPPMAYNCQIKLRCFQGSKVLVAQGIICGSSERRWKVDQLEIMSGEDRRAFFRQRIDAVAQMMPINETFDQKDGLKKGKQVPCQIVDVSMGGILISSKERFQEGDWLFVSGICIATEEKDFSFICRIQRYLEVGDEILYGCQFKELDTREQERLLRAIFIAQRKELHTQREWAGS